MGVKSAGVSFSFKLDLPKIDRSNLGFHDEFYSKLDEFSESWRNQALREKRFWIFNKYYCEYLNQMKNCQYQYAVFKNYQILSYFIFAQLRFRE